MCLHRLHTPPSFLCRFVRHHQHRVVGKDIDERIGVEGVLASLQAFPDEVQRLHIRRRRRKRSNMSSPQCQRCRHVNRRIATRGRSAMKAGRIRVGYP